MKVLINAIEVIPISREILISVDFISASGQHIKLMSYNFVFKSYSKDEIQTVDSFLSLPPVASIDDVFEVLNADESHPVGIYRYVSNAAGWLLESPSSYFGNALVNRALTDFQVFKSNMRLPIEEQLDYTEFTNFLGSIDYTRIFK